MSALSQNLTFKIANGNTTTNTVAVTYPNTATSALIYNSERIKGDGYFGGSDGLHTVFWSVSNFKGTLEVQATLASEPIEADWVTVRLTNLENRYEVDTTGAVTIAGIDSTRYTTPTTTSKSYNFVGNFVWVRAKVSDWTQGTVNVISINR